MPESHVTVIKYHSQLRIKESIEGVGSAENAEVDHKDWNLDQEVLNSSNTDLIDSFRRGGGEYTIGTGDTTIDLTALSGTQSDIDATGDKVQYLQLITDDENVAAITIKPGSSNPYNLFGSSNEIDLGAGVEVLAKFAETLDDVAAGAKTIEIAGTAGDKIKIQIVTGPAAGT